MSIVTSTDAQQQIAISTLDAFESEPGLTVQETNRGAGTLMIRGFIGPENLIVIDGMRFNQSTYRTGPNQYLNLLPIDLFSSIEVVRGPSGVLFGSGAMGGVVNARTDYHTGAFARFVFDQASDKQHAAGLATETIGDLELTLGATYTREGGFRAGAGERALFASVANDGETIAPAFDRGGVLVGARYDLGAARLSARYLGGFVADAPRVDRIGGGEVRFYDNDDHFASLRVEIDAGSLDPVEVTMMLHRSKERVARYNCRPLDADGLDFAACADRVLPHIERIRTNDDEVTTIGLSAISGIEIGAMSIRTGIDSAFDTVRSDAEQARRPLLEFRPQPRGNFSDSRYLNAGFFVAPTFALWSDKKHAIDLVGGARVEYFSAHADDVPDVGDVDYTFGAPVGSFGVQYFYGSSFHTYVMWNQGFRAPNLQETTVLGDTGSTFEVPNPDLKPERNNTIEHGLRFDHAFARVESVLFVALQNDRIAREEISNPPVEEKPVVRRVNRDRGYLYGAEWKVEFGPDVPADNPLLRLKPYASLALIDGAVTGDDAAFDPGPLHDLFAGDGTYENLRRLPPTRYDVGVRFDATPQLTASAFVRGAGKQARLAPGDRSDLRICETSPGELATDCTGSAAWTTLNLSARYASNHFAADIGLFNLTDVRYRRHGSGVPGAGRSIRAQFILRY